MRSVSGNKRGIPELCRWKSQELALESAAAAFCGQCLPIDSVRWRVQQVSGPDQRSHRFRPNR